MRQEERMSWQNSVMLIASIAQVSYLVIGVAIFHEHMIGK